MSGSWGRIDHLVCLKGQFLQGLYRCSQQGQIQGIDQNRAFARDELGINGRFEGEQRPKSPFNTAFLKLKNPLASISAQPVQSHGLRRRQFNIRYNTLIMGVRHWQRIIILDRLLPRNDPPGFPQVLPNPQG